MLWKQKDALGDTSTINAALCIFSSPSSVPSVGTPSSSMWLAECCQNADPAFYVIIHAICRHIIFYAVNGPDASRSQHFDLMAGFNLFIRRLQYGAPLELIILSLHGLYMFPEHPAMSPLLWTSVSLWWIVPSLFGCSPSIWITVHSIISWVLWIWQLVPNVSSLEKIYIL